MTTCPCGSGNTFANCCEQYINSSQVAKTPEQLMRSRYTAYTLGNVDYIQKSMLGKALVGYDKDSAKNWALSVTWLKLEVINSYTEGSTKGFVEFSAIYLQKNNKLQEIHELSEFILDSGLWYYIDGKMLANLNKYSNRKVPTNVECPCGSGRKFKSCHSILIK